MSRDPKKDKSPKAGRLVVSLGWREEEGAAAYRHEGCDRVVETFHNGVVVVTTQL